VTVARYHRVSTEMQVLDRQTSATEEYVAENFPDADTRTYADADTGTDTDRTDYQRLMDDATDGDVEVVVVKDMSRVARSVRDLMRTVDRLRDADVELHLIDDPIIVRPDDDDPTQDLILTVLAAVGEFQAKITRRRVREGIAARQESDDYQHGPAPLGFEKDDGTLVEAPEYHQVCAVLEMIEADEISKSEGARRLDCGRKTINRSLQDRRDLYGLPEKP